MRSGGFVGGSYFFFLHLNYSQQQGKWYFYVLKNVLATAIRAQKEKKKPTHKNEPPLH